MKTFEYVRPANTHEAVSLVSGRPSAAYLAGGTTQLDLMKDGVWTPDTLVDITRLPLRDTEERDGSLYVGALVTMEELAAHQTVLAQFPLIRESLLAGASTQLRNMATIGGNLLQRTRCRYFRDPAVGQCNKRNPGTGCAAVENTARMHAILGVDERCIALHASDVAVALVALDAVVHIEGVTGQRKVPLTDFYVASGRSPERENVLEHGELILGVEIPLLGTDFRSGYLKVRDRASYEFALTSAAVALRMTGRHIHEARIGLGGVGSKPWRAREAEQVLTDSPASSEVFQQAAEAALAGAWTVAGTAFKVDLAQRTLIRELKTLSGLEV
ncbi:FAD-binding molybdopterin dehydrogenase [Streptomyces sp. WAC 01325]|uniref:FAD binding domain-containing protein n=1 Tax=Streptomyces sp. WAC 01325 TaxID=2203202 RepID=UPI000F89BC9E|nr:xanthine dehydrogenase family protein subunit M [Streptomyces sp. WAC 01325]RSM93725.1 FAD-binding molybdopterin dehydrogenase [Streptomyces sp. WAC 01325]